MKKNKIMIAAALGAMTLGAHAQTQADSTKTQELRARGFGVQNASKPAQAGKTTNSQAQGNTDPTFPGGDLFLDAYIKKQRLLHKEARGNGDVTVSFRVDAKGSIHNAQITQSADSILDATAFKIVTGMPRWTPGLTNGQPADKPAKVTVHFADDK